MKRFAFGAAVIGLGVLLVGSMADAQQKGAARQPPETLSRGTECPPGPAGVSSLQAAGRELLAVADTNHDGMISKDEARNAADTIIGGLFFRADKNHDGIVTPDEAMQVRQEILTNHPYIRSLLDEIKAAKGKSAFSSIANLIDVNNDKKVDLAEAHKASQDGVNALFDQADVNKDGQLDQQELSNGAAKLSQVVMDSMFRTADTDHDGVVTEQEFERAVLSSARGAFQSMDTNHDNKLSLDEAHSAQQALGNALGITVPVPPAPAQDTGTLRAKPPENK